jgi:BirA family biotin operon repressor/biotin-[acetyl-CoA-carboxylase] ligase
VNLQGGLPGIDATRLHAAVAGRWDLRAVVPETGSTNDDAALVASLRRGDPSWPGILVVADHQTGGRGRRGRSWTAPPRTSVAVSVAFTPPVATARWGWIPLLAGQAVRDSVTTVADLEGGGVTARIKWPNDVLLDGGSPGESPGKLSGVLAEVRGTTAVVGAGINTNLGSEDLPSQTATSLRLATGRVVDPTEVVAGYLLALHGWLTRWVEADGDAAACGLREAHLATSATVGRDVDVHTPTGTISGRAVDVDAAGSLVVERAGQERVSLSAGDVVHVRRAD